jgi:CDP-diacylglycerol--glycerol-3-phosphate 3-phosphatidyltransferase
MASGALRIYTRANLLTAVRLLCGPLLVAALLAPSPGWAAGLFWLAVATDLLDGRVARRFGESSALGGFLDHVTDAAFVSLGLAALAVRGEAPAALPALVALAFVQYALDSRVIAGQRLRASALGRWNGIAYFVPVGAVVVRDALGLAWPAPGLVLGLGWALAASTLLSMADRALALIRSRRSR